MRRIVSTAGPVLIFIFILAWTEICADYSQADFCLCVMNPESGCRACMGRYQKGGGHVSFDRADAAGAPVEEPERLSETEAWQDTEGACPEELPCGAFTFWRTEGFYMEPGSWPLHSFSDIVLEYMHRQDGEKTAPDDDRA